MRTSRARAKERRRSSVTASCSPRRAEASLRSMRKAGINSGATRSGRSIGRVPLSQTVCSFARTRTAISLRTGFLLRALHRDDEHGPSQSRLRISADLATRRMFFVAAVAEQFDDADASIRKLLGCLAGERSRNISNRARYERKANCRPATGAHAPMRSLSPRERRRRNAPSGRRRQRRSPPRGTCDKSATPLHARASRTCNLNRHR